MTNKTKNKNKRIQRILDGHDVFGSLSYAYDCMIFFK